MVIYLKKFIIFLTFGNYFFFLVVIIALFGGVITFIFSLFPATNPSLYGDVEKSIYWYNITNS
jgi:hypothetical protein